MKYLSILIAALMLSSCSTLEENLKIEKAPKVIDNVVPSLVKIGVAKQPKSVPYLESLVIVIDSFALGEDLSPDELEKVIKSAKIKELETPEALAVVNSVVVLYKAYYDAAVVDKVNSVEHLNNILTSLSKAITKGLQKATNTK